MQGAWHRRTECGISIAHGQPAGPAGRDAAERGEVKDEPMRHEQADPAAARLPRGFALGEPGAWRRAPLHLRFAMIGSVVVLIGMLVIGWWVGREIENGVTRNSAISTALYMESFIAPLSQELGSGDALAPETAERLRALFREPTFAERIASVKLWKPEGLVAFSTDQDLIGKRFAPTPPLAAAWKGALSAEFDDLAHAPDYVQHADDVPYLEVYNPIHSIYTGEIIAVAEFYQIATELERDIFDARLKSWAVVGGVSLAMSLMLFGIVRQGSRTIERQTEELRARIGEVNAMAAQNTRLRRHIQGASRRAGEHNERLLRRISAELHDGPAQDLALAALRLDSAFRQIDPDRGREDAETIRASLDAAMREIRAISSGLSLPEIDGKSVLDTLSLAIETHERRTQSSVGAALDEPALDLLHLDHPSLICVYRFVQEGLNNAWRHAAGRDQRVAAWLEDSTLVVTVEDGGAGFDPGSLAVGSDRLGLLGLRERIESVGGQFAVTSAPGAGTTLRMALLIEETDP